MSIDQTQTFIDADAVWQTFDGLPGVCVIPLAEPVAKGSFHRAKLTKDTTIPVHTHPVDEYVYVISGVVETGGRRCETGTFWKTPAHTRQGPHVALTDVEILTCRLGPLGTFEEH